MIKVIRSKPLQVLDFDQDIIEEIDALLNLAYERNSNIAWILQNKEFSSSMKLKWLSCYLREWNDAIGMTSNKIREKYCITSNVISIDTIKRKLVVLELNLDIYKKICEENDYLVQVNH